MVLAPKASELEGSGGSNPSLFATHPHSFPPYGRGVGILSEKKSVINCSCFKVVWERKIIGNTAQTRYTGEKDVVE